jgi:hypothetical protein
VFSVGSLHILAMPVHFARLHSGVPALCLSVKPNQQTLIEQSDAAQSILITCFVVQTAPRHVRSFFKPLLIALL